MMAGGAVAEGGDDFDRQLGIGSDCPLNDELEGKFEGFGNDPGSFSYPQGQAVNAAGILLPRTVKGDRQGIFQ
jgi:hypothetical protein